MDHSKAILRHIKNTMDKIDELVRDLTRTMPMPVAKSLARKKISEFKNCLEVKFLENEIKYWENVLDNRASNHSLVFRSIARIEIVRMKSRLKALGILRLEENAFGECGGILKKRTISLLEK